MSADGASQYPLAHLADALFRPMGVDGVYARTALYVDLVERLEQYITRQRSPDAEIMRFPPVMSRTQLEKSGYLKSFPNLLGLRLRIARLGGLDPIGRRTLRQRRRLDHLADLVGSGAVAGRLLSRVSHCGRARHSCRPADCSSISRQTCSGMSLRLSLDRLQSFRMREFVRIGSPDEIVDFREKWMARAPLLAAELGLPHSIDVANDPFFGRVGQVMAVSQRQQALKFELLIPYYPSASPTACMSFNYHREHFGQVWGIRDNQGELAHTSCVAFGIDRLAVALFANHGLDLRKWPATARPALAL